ncbi:hypothetical protein AB9E31_35990, partial [Rhizobium leguminosarum]
LDPETSKQKWAAVQKIFADDLPMLPLYFYPRAYVTVTDLTNFRQGTLDPLHIWSEEWQRQLAGEFKPDYPKIIGAGFQSLPIGDLLGNT